MSVLTPYMESVLQSTVIAREKPWMHFETAYDQDGIQLEHVEMQAPPPPGAWKLHFYYVYWPSRGSSSGLITLSAQIPAQNNIRNRNAQS